MNRGITTKLIVAIIALASCFASLCVLREDWLFTNPYILPWFDPFVYLGFFLRYPEYVKAYPGYYPGERLSVIIPGYLIFKAFEPSIASVVIRTLLWFGSCGALLLSTSIICGWRAGLLATLLLGLHPTFLGAAGWDYIDGFANCYHFAAWAILSIIIAGRRSNGLYATFGATLALMFLSSTFMAVFIAPLIAVLTVATYSGSVKAAFRSWMWILIGSIAVILAVTLINVCAGGPAFIFASQYNAMRQLLSGQIPATDPSAWQPILWNAPWAALPLVMALFGTFKLPSALMSLRNLRSLDAVSRTRALLPALALYQMMVYGFLQATSFTALSFFCYSSMLVPLCFLGLASLISEFSANFSRRAFIGLSLFSAFCSLLTLHPKVGKLILDCYSVGYYKTFTIIPVVGFCGALLAFSSIKSDFKKGLGALALFCIASATTFNTPQINHFWHERRTYGIRAIAEAVNHFQDSNRDGQLGMWMNTRDPKYGDNIFWASWIANHIRAGSFRSTDLPAFDPKTASHGSKVMVFTSENNGNELVTKALRDQGLSHTVVSQRRIVHGRIDFWMTLISLN